MPPPVRVLDRLATLVVQAEEQPSRGNNGRFVIVTAELGSEERLGDEHLKPQSALRLERTIERFPWDRQQPEHASWQVETAFLGGYGGDGVFRHVLGEHGTNFLPIHRSMLKNPDLPVIDGRIYLRSRAGRNSVGDQRISYRVLPARTYTAIARQDGDTLSPLPAAGFLVTPGVASFQQMRRFVASGSELYRYACLFYALGLMWPGVMMILLPFNGTFKTMGFLNDYRRLLPVLVAAPLTFLVLAIARQSPSWFALILVSSVFVVGVVQFIIANRETPNVKAR